MSIEQRLKTAGFATDTLKPLAKTDQGQLWSITTPGGQTAIDLWHRLRSQLHVTMHTPIVIGETGEAEQYLSEAMEDSSASVDQILREAAMVDGSEVLERLVQGGDLNQQLQDAIGDWPTDAAPSTADFTTVNDLDGQPLQKVTIALVPTIASWMAPAYLKFGGFNACPAPEDHVSMMKYWTRLYAIDVFAITHDTIECLVSNPPTDQDRALALAKEQYAYCFDIVEQGTETIANLAGNLLNGRSWFFWWD